MRPMDESKSKGSHLSVWEGASIITGYGVGGSIMSMPYMTEKVGICYSLVIILAAFLLNMIAHLMIADLCLKGEKGNQLITLMAGHLLKGRARILFSKVFFWILAAGFCINLAVYITGASDILISLTGIHTVPARLLFYMGAAVVALFGMKAIGICEKIVIILIFVVIGILAAASLLQIKNPLPFKIGSIREDMAFFGLAMLAFGAYFSIPQIVDGVGREQKKIVGSVFLGFFNTLVIVLVIIFCSLLSGGEVTSVAMIGWSRGLGPWAEVMGSIFTLLAMMTAFWSMSFALQSVVCDQYKKVNSKLAWIGGTLPAVAVTFLPGTGFIGFMRIAAGMVSVVIAMLLVPAYRRSRHLEGPAILGKGKGLLVQMAVFAAFIMMGIGSFLPI